MIVLKFAQLFALFIIGFMAFSTVAFVLSMNSGGNQGGNTASPDTNAPTQTTRITYTAQVDANVLEVFSSFKMVSATKEFDIAKIDSAIAQVDGVTNLKSIFRQGASQSGVQATTYYVADISFDSKKASFEAVSSAIGEKTSGFFSGMTGFFPNALVVVPKKLSLGNADLNLSKSYEITDNVIQSYVNSGTLKGDEILVRVEIAFIGEQPVSTLSSEVSNYSQEQKQHTASLSLPLVELLPKLTFTADANYSDKVAEDALKAELLKISDVNSVELSVEPVYYKMLLTIKKPFSDSLEQDLNNALLLVNGIKDIEFVPDENALNAIIGFPEEASLQPLKNSIATQLSSLGVSDKNFYFTEPTVLYSGAISLKTTDAKTAAESVKAFFVSKKFASKVYQNGLLKVSSLTDEQTKETFAVDSNSVEAAIFPVHKLGDEIFASVLFYSQRGKLLNASALEIVNPVRIS